MHNEQQEKLTPHDAFFDAVDAKTLALLKYIGVEAPQLGLFITAPLSFLGDMLPKATTDDSVTDCIKRGENIGICLSESGQRIRQMLKWDMPSWNLDTIIRDIQRRFFSDPGHAFADKAWEADRGFWQAVEVLIRCLPPAILAFIILRLLSELLPGRRKKGLGQNTNKK